MCGVHTRVLYTEINNFFVFSQFHVNFLARKSKNRFRKIIYEFDQSNYSSLLIETSKQTVVNPLICLINSTSSGHGSSNSCLLPCESFRKFFDLPDKPKNLPTLMFFFVI